ncbi:MAG TPA: outer membrane lipid asymmetry maintenance protein MlaD [Burkholderiaceae bacterium]|nr:outer membrane lipid asymmetry maintenance protein MlaD [Burkholderiaceae bacterium]
MGRKGIEILVGLFVLVGILAILFLALKSANLASLSNGSTYEVTARFDNIGGLKMRAPVRSAGVAVGRVKRITFDNKTFQGIVTLELQSQFEFPVDTSAKIVTAGLLGDQYISLEPGGDDKNLAAGGVIKSTQSALVLENLIGQFLYSKAAEGGGDAKGGDTKGGGDAKPAPEKATKK